MKKDNLKVSYEKINEAINSVFFDGRFQGLPIYLDLEDEIQDEVSKKLGCDPGDVDSILGHAVSETIFLDEKNIYKYHLEELNEWRKDPSLYKKPPPFTALLLLLSLAAERMRKEEDYSQTNYYQRLNEALHYTSYDEKNKISHNGRNTKIFWSALNLWLIQNNYDYGRPTAGKVTNWAYVSYAISQSLIRDAERQSFQKLFKKNKLSSHDCISEAEMTLYLHEWMASNEPSPWLKRIWNDTDLRERVILSALHELETWENDKEETTREVQGKNLFWALAIQTLPRKIVRMFLCSTGSDDIQNKPLLVSQGTQSAGKKAFEACDNLWFTKLVGSEFYSIEPVNKIYIDALIHASFELASSEMGTKYSYEARPIIPLIKLDTSQFYKQVTYLSLYSTHMVLCHEKWAGKVSNYLVGHARPGYRQFTNTEYQGIPRGWILFDEVQLVKIPTEDIEANLQCLVPFAEGVTVSFQEGLKLSNGIWHSSAPPQVYASDEHGILNIELIATGVSNKESIIFEQDAGSFNPDFLRDDGLELDANNFTLVALKDNKKLAQRAISFRSAKVPRNLHKGRDEELAYVIGNKPNPDAMPNTVNIDDIKEGDCYLRGMVVHGDIEIAEATFLDITRGLNNLKYTEEEFWSSYGNCSIDDQVESCIIKGYHYWLCEPSHGYYSPIRNEKMRCKNCGLEIYVKNYKKKKKVDNKKINKYTKKVDKYDASVTGRKKQDITPDIVFDGICYIGAGNARVLDAVTSEIEMQPWQVTEVRRNLVDLGHIDVYLDLEHRTFKSWSCAPPALVITASGNAFLSGFRNGEMIENLLQGLAENHIEVDIIEQELAPSACIINNYIPSIEPVINGIVDPHGRKIKIVKEPAISILSSMPLMKNFKEFMKVIHVEDDNDVEKFDLQSGRFIKSGISGAGAYRTFLQGRCYFFHGEDGTSYKGDYNSVKVLAARENRTMLHGYNKNTSSFECVLGCEPPGLYKRALISCSGLLPKISDGKVTYKNVPEAIAGHILYRLYS